MSFIQRLFALTPMARATKVYAFGIAHLPADLPPGPLLEIGTGQGYGAAYLSRALPQRQVVAIDVTRECFKPQRLTFGPLRPWFVQASAPYLPFAAARFALATAVMTFHCLPEPQRVFHEIARVLRPGGIFLVADVDGHHPIAPWFERVEHWGGISPITRAYTPEALQSLARTAGLTVAEHFHRKPGGFVVWHLFRKPPDPLEMP